MIRETMRDLAYALDEKVLLLAWRMVRTLPTGGIYSTTTLAMVRGMCYSIVIEEGFDGQVSHRTKEHPHESGAEYHLNLESKQAGDIMTLQPTEFLVPRPPHEHTETAAFMAWEHQEVLNRVTSEIGMRTHGYGSVLTFGTPEPAFPRERAVTKAYVDEQVYSTKLGQHPELTDTMRADTL